MVHIICGDDLCVITVEGVVKTSNLLAIQERHYPLIGERSLLWNMTKADLKDVTEEHFSDIAALAAMSLGPSATRKIAYVVRDNDSFRQVTKLTNTAFFQVRVPAEYCVFLDVETARAWLARD